MEKGKHGTTSPLPDNPYNPKQTTVRKDLDQTGNPRNLQTDLYNSSLPWEHLLEKPLWVHHFINLGCTAKKTEISHSLMQRYKSRLDFEKRVKRKTFEEHKRQKRLFRWNGNWTLSHKTKLSVRQKLGTAHYPFNSTPAAKHGGGSVMLWRSFSAEGSGRLVRMEGTMNGTKWTNFLGELVSECQKP